MEAALMAVYTPWQVEMLGAADIPLKLTPVRRYISPERGEEVVQVRQGSFKGWM
jgi:hypothetical protein